MSACQQGNNGNTFTFNVNASNLEEAEVILSLEGDSTIFSGTLENGALSIEMNQFPAQYAMVQITGFPNPIVYYHDGSDVSISTNETEEGIDLDVQSGVLQDSAMALKAKSDEFGLEMQQLESAYRTAQSNMDSEAIRQIQESAEALMERQYAYNLEFAKRNGILGAAIVLATNAPSWTAADYQAVLDGIDSEHHDSPDYEKLSTKIEDMNLSAVGAQFKDFTQATPDGGELSILSVSGEYVLVDFWASWCRPCRATNPALVQLYSEFSDRGFNIVGISLDQDKEKWVAGIAEDGLTWPQVSDLNGWRNEISQYYKIQYIPQNLLLDDNGIIVGKNMTPEELTAFLNGNLD